MFKNKNIYLNSYNEVQEFEQLDLLNIVNGQIVKKGCV